MGHGLANQLETRVGDEGHSRVGHQRQPFAAAQRVENRRPHPVGVVVVVGRERLVDPRAGGGERGRQPPRADRPPPGGPPASPPAAVAATPLPPPAGAGPVKVALLVPLSGPNADLGKSMLEAAQLALFQTGNDQLTLVPRDTGGTPDGAANAARAVIGEGAKLILGPLLAGEGGAVKASTREASVPVLAFSTATQLAGGNIFLMGFLPKQEVVREVAFARERGLSRFAALAPNTAYGHLMGEALRDIAASSGATVVKVEYFDPRGGDVATIVKRLVPSSASPTT